MSILERLTEELIAGLDSEELIEALQVLEKDDDHMAGYIAAYSWHENFEHAAREHLRKKL